MVLNRCVSVCACCEERFVTQKKKTLSFIGLGITVGKRVKINVDLQDAELTDRVWNGS